MRNTKKYINKLFNAGIELQNGGVYWLNGDASLKASQRQKFRKILGWITDLPKKLKEKFDLDYDIVIGSTFYESNREECFEIYGFDRNTEQDIFNIREVVNDLDENDGQYVHHWEGFKKLLKMIDVNNLDNYLDNYFKEIEIVVDKEGNYNVSHTESIHGIQKLINLLYDEDRFDPEKVWEFKNRIWYAGYRRFIGCYHASSNEDLIFWESSNNRLLTLRVWYSYEEGSIEVVNYEWSELHEIKWETGEDTSYIYKWDPEKMEDILVTKNNFK